MAVLHYQQIGSGSDVILIHGLFGSLENLNMVAKGLKDHYRVTNVDVRNHGHSFQQAGMDYPDLAQDIIDTMNEANIDTAAVLGHSMGGKIAMELALSCPERVKKLVVADIAPVSYPAHHQHIIQGLKSIDLSAIKSRTDADKQLSEYVKEPGVRQFLLRNLTKTEQGFAFKCHLDNIANGYQQIMQAYQGEKTFSGPTLFVKGGQSNYIQSKDRDIILTLFPHSSAKIIQGAGHWLHAEKTVAFNKIVKDFISVQ